MIPPGESKAIRDNFSFCERFKHFLTNKETRFLESLDPDAEARFGMHDEDRKRLDKIVKRLTDELA